MAQQYGLAMDGSGTRYLAEQYGLTFTEFVAGIPVFRDRAGEYHAGGYKAAYTVLVGDPTETLRALERWRKGKRVVHYCFTTERNLFGSKRLDSILLIPPGTAPESRLALYGMKVRNQVRQAGKTRLRYRVEPPPAAWHDLYCRSMARLGSVPRPREWFARFEGSFAGNVRCVSAYDGDTLAGALYFLFTKDYLSINFLASDPEYWDLRINNGLYDGAVLFAIEHDIPLVDFGPTMAYDEKHLHIKEGFGAKPCYCADTFFCNPFLRAWRKFLRYVERFRALGRRLRRRFFKTTKKIVASP